jgi:nicotinate-nucleotide adenylyltransferase
MRIGVFGGTFDPPHLGHNILAAEAAWQLSLNRVLWVLTPGNPLKSSGAISPINQRIELVQAAVAGDPLFELSSVDLDRPAPYYTVDTLRLLAAQHPGAELVFLMGGDSLRDLPRWHHPVDILAACACLGVMRRPGSRIDMAALERQLPGLFAKVQWIQAPRVDISAKLIRQRIKYGGPYRCYLSEAVYRLIQARNYYSAGRS